MKKNIITTFIIVIISLATGCNKYLDIHPKSSISEDQMFESAIGFQQALVGVYSQMASPSLYGDRLSLGFVSALAQDYGMTANGAPYLQTRLLNYTSGEVVGHLSTIWRSSYTAIAEINKVIVNTEERRSVLTNEGYAQIRGEALAVRAYLHFELLRLFGPEYQSGKDAKAIPYRTMADHYGTPPSLTSEVIQKALNDLQEAAGLLQGVDPIMESSDIRRRIKMNYYAVKGLEARIRLYIGDKPGAYSAAMIVVDSERFPFVNISNAGAAEGTRDRIYLSELVFAVRCRAMADWVDGYFRWNMGEGYRLYRTAAEYDQIYENSATDIRRLHRFDVSQTALFPSKFWQTHTGLADESPTSPNRRDQIVPLIRITEMYYILAETAPTVAEGITSLNTVRRARGIGNDLPTNGATAEFLEAELSKEYEKEFYGEGQIFFYYKRKNFTHMKFRAAEVPLSLYQLPIPDGELEYNPTY